MTKIEELEQKLNELLKTITKEEMIKALEEAGFEVIDKESKKEGKWKPALYELYWYRGDEGINIFDTWENNEIDEWRRKNLKIFETEEECERYWHFMDTVKEKSYEFSKEEWEDKDIHKFYICYDYERKIFYPSFAWDCQIFGRFYFKTEEDAQYIIDNFKDELMEYWI